MRDPRRRRRSRKRDQRARRRRGGKALRALTSSALALPGLAGSAEAAAPVSRIAADYNYSFYQEDSLKSSDVAQGDKDRYDIEIHQFHLEAPLGERSDFQLDVAYESMSGASPFYILPDAEKDAKVVMTGASIEDVRTDVSGRGNLYTDWGKASLGAGFSTEDDYLSFNASLGADRDFNNKNSTWSNGIGFSTDEIDPTGIDPLAAGPREDGYKHTITLFTGLSQVVGRKTVIQSTLTYQHQRGFLSDPYKDVFVGDLLLPIPIVRDNRPDRRHQFAWLSRLRHHFERPDSTVHLDYQLYADDWGIFSNAVDLAWHQNLFDVVKLVPSVRYYAQSEADFYATYFDSLPDDGYVSSDYRLSAYGALALRIRAETKLPVGSTDWRLTAGYERYMSHANLGFTKSDIDNPALVSFNLFTVGLTGRF